MMILVCCERIVLSIYFLRPLKTIFTASLIAGITCASSLSLAPDARAELDQATTTAEIQAVKARLKPKEKTIVNLLDGRLDDKPRKQVIATMSDITLRTTSGEYSQDLVTAIAAQVYGHKISMDVGGEFFAVAIKRYPNNCFLPYFRGASWLVVDENKLAAPDLLRAIALNPRYSEPHEKYALLLRNQKQEKAALAEMQIAEKLSPDKPSIQGNKADLLALLGRYDEAIAAYKKASELSDGHENWLADFHRGRLLLKLKRYGEAYEVFKHLNTLNDRPKSGIPTRMAESLIGLKRYKEAVPVLEKVLKTYDDIETHRLLLQAYKGVGDKAGAAREAKFIDAFEGDFRPL